MPITDYNKKKKLEATSQNDSGATVDKAQPVLISSAQQEEYIPGTSATIDAIDTTVQLKTQGFISQVGFEPENDGLSATIRIQDSGGTTLASKSITTSTGTWNTVTFNESDYSRIPDNEDITIDFDGLQIFKETESYTGDLFDINDDVAHYSSSSGGTAIKVETLGEDKTGTGNIVVDDSNISSQSDIAFYDQNGNLLPYELENGDTAITSSGISGTLVGWVYNPEGWTRDDSVQAQVVYGDGPTSSEEDVTGTWNNTGQNARAVYHLNESSGQTIDSTSNNNDSTNTTGTVYNNSGQFDGARGFDGTDDQVLIPDSTSLSITSEITILAWIKPDSFSNRQQIASKDDDTEGRKFDTQLAESVRGGSSSDNNTFAFGLVDSGGNFKFASSTNEKPDNISTADTWYQVAGTYDGSTLATNVNATQTASQSVSITINDVNADLGIGARTFSTSEEWFDGDIDAVRIYSEGKNQAWLQADYDASPKAGQVFFSQQAAETTTNDQTVSVPETQLNTDNPAPTLNTGTTTVAVTPTTLTTDNPNPAVVAGAVNISANETVLTASNPDPTVQSGLTINAPETNLTTDNPAPTVIPGTATINSPETILTVQNPQPALNRQVVVGQETQLTASTPNPAVVAGEATVSPPETTITTDSPATTVVPGTSRIAVTPTVLNTETVDPTLVAGATTLSVPETELTTTTKLPDINISDLRVIGDTKALITTPNKYAVMNQHTFKKGDTGDILEVTLEDESGAIPLQNVTDVKIKMQNTVTGNTVLNASMTVTDGPNGKAEYEWESGDPIETVGVYRTEFEILDGTGDPDTVPNEGYTSIKIEEDLNG